MAGSLTGSTNTVETVTNMALGGEVAKNAVEHNYLTEKESLSFEQELKVCKDKGDDCTAIYQKYLKISHDNFESTRNRCVDGGIVCAGMEEVITAATTIALVKDDKSGKLYFGKYLTDDDAINFVKYVNGNDLSYLDNRVTKTDRFLYHASDITNWIPLALGTKGLLTNNTKEALLAAGIGSMANAVFQYTFSDDGIVNWSDVVMSGVVGKVTAGKSYATVINANALGGYYSSKLNGEGNDAAESALISRAAAGLGYPVGKFMDNSLSPIFNPNYKKYQWHNIGMGISKQEPPSVIPSIMAGSFDSFMSEATQERTKKLLNTERE